MLKTFETLVFATLSGGSTGVIRNFARIALSEIWVGLDMGKRDLAKCATVVINA